MLPGNKPVLFRQLFSFSFAFCSWLYSQQP
jgi:hypothetical protein